MPVGLLGEVEFDRGNGRVDVEASVGKTEGPLLGPAAPLREVVPVPIGSVGF